jgi:hypothetical protein
MNSIFKNRNFKIAMIFLIIAVISFWINSPIVVDSFGSFMLIALTVIFPLGFCYYFLLNRILKTKLILVYTMMLIIPLAASMYIDKIENEQTGVIIGTLFAFGPLAFLIITSLVEVKKHHTIILFFICGIISSLVIKSLHWPGGGALMALSFGTLIFIYLEQMVSTIIVNKGNRFLQIMGSFCSLILAIGYGSFLFKVMHWPFSYAMYQTALPLYLGSSLILIIGIQITDFTNWVDSQRRFLVRNVLIPWLFIFVISGVRILFPDTWNYLMNVDLNIEHDAHWGIYEV